MADKVCLNCGDEEGLAPCPTCYSREGLQIVAMDDERSTYRCYTCYPEN